MEKSVRVFAQLIQCLDEESLSLIIWDAKDKSTETLAILREHYLSKSKSKIILLYIELTSLRKSSTKMITNFVIQTEKSSIFLNKSGEIISNSLFIVLHSRGRMGQGCLPLNTISHSERHVIQRKEKKKRKVVS